MAHQYLKTTEMQALERHAFENFPITLEQMMQNAGKAIFDVVMQDIKPDGPILVVTGKGNNGGDALVTALLLHEKGIQVTVLSPYPDEEFTESAGRELKKVREAGIKTVENFDTLSKSDHHRISETPLNIQAGLSGYSLIIDALFGFSLAGNPRPPTDQIIKQINNSNIPVLSVDVPSGLDVHTGNLGNPTVKADYTVALGMLKKGFEEHPEYVGKVYLGDLGIPKQAYLDMGYSPPPFKEKAYLNFPHKSL